MTNPQATESAVREALEMALRVFERDFPNGSGVELLRAALSSIEGAVMAGWQPIETAPKDGTRILVLLKNPIPKDRDDLRAWDGIPFVARHPGLADDGFDAGWNFAAPVGHGGFPDEWMVGWKPLDAPPQPGGR